MNKLDVMVAQMAESMNLESMSDEQIRFIARDAEEAVDCARDMGTDATKYVLQALACYAERDARRSRVPYVDVSYEVIHGGDAIKLSNQVRAF